MREEWTVMDEERGLSDLFGPVMLIVGHQLCECFQSMQRTVLIRKNRKKRARERGDNEKKLDV